MAEFRRRFAGCVCKLHLRLRKYIARVGHWINNPDHMVGLNKLLGHCESIVPPEHKLFYVIVFLRVVVIVWLVVMQIRELINTDRAKREEG